MEDEIEDWWASQRENGGSTIFPNKSHSDGGDDTSPATEEQEDEIRNPFVARLAAQRDRTATGVGNGSSNTSPSSSDNHHTQSDLNAHLGAPNVRGRKLGGLNDIFAKRAPVLVGEDARFAKFVPDIVTHYADALDVTRPTALAIHVLDSFSHYMSTDLVIIKPYDTAMRQPIALTEAQTEFLNLHKQLLTTYKRAFGPDSSNSTKGNASSYGKSAKATAATASTTTADATAAKPGMEAEYLFVETSRYITLPRYYALSLYGPLILLPHRASNEGDGSGKNAPLQYIALPTTASHRGISEIACRTFNFPLRPSPEQMVTCFLHKTGGVMMDVRPRDTWRDLWLQKRDLQLQQQQAERDRNKATKTSKKRALSDMTWDALNEDGIVCSSSLATTTSNAATSARAKSRAIVDPEYEPWPAPIRLFDLTQPVACDSGRSTEDLLAHPNPLHDTNHMQRLLRQQEDALRSMSISSSSSTNYNPLCGPPVDMYTQPLRLNATLRKEPIDQLPIVAAIVSLWRNATAIFRCLPLHLRNTTTITEIYKHLLNTTLPGCMVCLPCGVGKTIISIAAWLWALRDDFDPYFTPELLIDVMNRKSNANLTSASRNGGATPLVQTQYVETRNAQGQGVVERRTVIPALMSPHTVLPTSSTASTTTTKNTQQLPKLVTRDDLRQQLKPRRTLRALFLIRTDDLIKQTFKAIQDIVPDVRVGIIQRDQRPKDPTSVDICIISTDTLAGQSFDPEYFSKHFGILITDEAHWNQSDFFLQALRKLPILYVASFTATPRDPRLPDLMGPVLVYRNRPYQPQQVKMIVYDCGRKLERRMLTGRGGGNNEQAPRYGIGSQNGIFDRQTQIADTTVDMRRNAWLAKLSMQVVCTRLPTHEVLCPRKTWDDTWGARLEWSSSTTTTNGSGGSNKRSNNNNRHLNNSRLVFYQRGGLMAAMDGIRSNTLEGDVIDSDHTRYTSFPPPKHKRPPLSKAMRQAHVERQRAEMAMIEAARSTNMSMEVDDPHLDDDGDPFMVHIRQQQAMRTAVTSAAAAATTISSPSLGLAKARAWTHKPVSRIITNDNLYMHHDPEKMKRCSIFFSNSVQHLIMHQHWQAQQWLDTCTSVPREYLMIVRTNIRELSVVDVRALSPEDWSHLRWLGEWRDSSNCNASSFEQVQSFCLAGNWLKAVRDRTNPRAVVQVPGSDGERMSITAPFPKTGAWKTSLYRPEDAPLNQRTLGTISALRGASPQQWQQSTVSFDETFFTTWFAIFPACLKHSWETRTPLLADALVQKHKKAKKAAAAAPSFSSSNKMTGAKSTSAVAPAVTAHTADRDLYMHLTDASSSPQSTTTINADDADDVSLNPSDRDCSSWMHVSQFYWTPIYGPLPMEQVMPSSSEDDVNDDESSTAVVAKPKKTSKKVRDAEAAQRAAEYDTQVRRAAAMTDLLLGGGVIAGVENVAWETWMSTPNACPNDLKREMFKHAGDVPRALDYSTRPNAKMPGTLVTFGLLMGAGANYPVPRRCLDPAYFANTATVKSKTMIKTGISPSHQTSVKACDYILATYEFGSTGLDIQRVETCIQGTSETDDEQSKGRGQRFMPNKQDFTLVEFVEPRFMYRNTALTHQKAHIAESATLEYYRIEYEHDVDDDDDDKIL